MRRDAEAAGGRDGSVDVRFALRKGVAGMRYRLRQALVEAWEDLVAIDYQGSRINSERSLQAALWSRLNESLESERYRLFVEPSFASVGSKKRVQPDLVVCNTRSVIAVVELKYEPRKSPSFKKDMRTLASLSEQRSELSIQNARFLGETQKADVYRFAEKTLFVWAGVYRVKSQPVEPVRLDLPDSLRGCFLSLHAVTQASRAPVTFIG